MKIAVIGTGYVGLVTGACLADIENDVTCVDVDEQKIDALTRGEIPIYEPGLAEVVSRNAQANRLRFTTDLPRAVAGARLVFLAVGTPQGDDGAADLSALWVVVDQIAPHLAAGAIVVTKSTVPVGTNTQINARLRERLGRECDIASNPEFLKEGAAIDDFTKPDRVVVGVRRQEVADVLHDLYAPLVSAERPFLVMSPESAEMTKYVANAMLATKISFINEMANLCQKTGADVNQVRKGIGHDARIGFSFLAPGVGYGGSCFPKDVRALACLARKFGLTPRMLEAVDEVNDNQKHVMFDSIKRHFQGHLADRTIAVWGLAFKPRTDDIREAPALVLLDQLLAAGVNVRVHDPEAMDNVRCQYGDRVVYCDELLTALAGVDALAIMTEWEHYQAPDLAAMRAQMNSPVIFDGRNLLHPEQMAAEGFSYHSIGRESVEQPRVPSDTV